MQSNYKTINNHGGDLKEAEELFGCPEEGWLDLSTGVNLKAYPNIELTNLALQMLPQNQQMDLLLSAARNFYKVPADLGIVAAPGSQAFIQFIPTLFSKRNVTIVGPTYAEHKRNWLECGHTVSIVDSLENIKKSEIIVIVNPNNPNGKIIPYNELLCLANEKLAKNGLLVIDEAFADVDSRISVISHLTNTSTVVLRSFGKFFGLPGLRLGFAISTPSVVDQLAKTLGPWAVSGPAIEIGTRALKDYKWISETQMHLIERRKYFDSIIQNGGLKIIGGTNLFRLIEFEHAQKLFCHLGKLGIFVRKFPEKENWLRLGVPNSKHDFNRFEKAFIFALSELQDRIYA